MTFSLFAAAVIGLGATGLIDLWNQVLRRTLDISSLNYCLLGRWLGHMPAGTFRHPNITAAAPRRFECAAGWIAHYTIGAVLAMMFVALDPSWLSNPRLLPALLFGIATVAFPLFLLQPALGLGVAASRTPDPPAARLKSIGTHTVFGIGLYVAALLLRAI